MKSARWTCPPSQYNLFKYESTMLAECHQS
jgi:hypothetical protein